MIYVSYRCSRFIDNPKGLFYIKFSALLMHKMKTSDIIDESTVLNFKMPQKNQKGQVGVTRARLRL